MTTTPLTVLDLVPISSGPWPAPFLIAPSSTELGRGGPGLSRRRRERRETNASSQASAVMAHRVRRAVALPRLALPGRKPLLEA